jgi:hypothetical protein
VPQPPVEPLQYRASADTPDWSPTRQRVAIAIWASFLAAAAATVVCFAFIDPAAIELLDGADTALARMTGYALGFFLFWLASAGASLLTLFLVRTTAARRRPQ